MPARFATALAALLAFVAVPNTWGQSSAGQELVRVRTLPLDVHSRPEPQLVATDDDQRVLAYLVFVTSAER